MSDLQETNGLSTETMDFFYNMVDESKKKEKEVRETSSPAYIKYDEKNYLPVKLNRDKGEVGSKTVTCRILDTFDPSDKVYGQVPLKEVYSHTIKMKDGSFRTFTCLKHTKGIDHLGFGHECPFCLMSDALLEEAKKIKDKDKNREKFIEAMGYKAKVQWICRTIDRNDEEHGPKFWRFDESRDGKGVFDKLKVLYDKRKAKCNIYDRLKGKDLDIDIVGKVSTTGVLKSSINQILDSDEVTPLSEDVNKANTWINDFKKWWMVFPPKPFGFLEIAVLGHTPMLLPGTTDVWTSKNTYDAITAKNGIPVYDEAIGDWVDGTNAVKEAEDSFEEEVEGMNFDVRGESIDTIIDSTPDTQTECSDLPF